MSSTKKLLIAFDVAVPNAQATDFLVPWNHAGQRVLLGTRSGKVSALGMMVYVGRAVSEDDLLAKMIHSGIAIADVDATLALLQSYIEGLQSLKIGNVVRISPTDQDNGPAFKLELVAKTPSGIKSE